MPLMRIFKCLEGYRMTADKSTSFSFRADNCKRCGRQLGLGSQIFYTPKGPLCLNCELLRRGLSEYRKQK